VLGFCPPGKQSVLGDRVNHAGMRETDATGPLLGVQVGGMQQGHQRRSTENDKPTSRQQAFCRPHWANSMGRIEKKVLRGEKR